MGDVRGAVTLTVGSAIAGGVAPGAWWTVDRAVEQAVHRAVARAVDRALRGVTRG